MPPLHHRHRVAGVAGTPLISQLTEQLTARGLLPDPTQAPYVCGRILLLGQVELRELLRALPHCSIDAAFSISRLGFGYTLTEFALAPLHLGAESKSILSLGALANLIVTLFDIELDAGRPGFNAAIDSLISEYFKRLNALCSDRARTATIQKAIARMYDAETATASRGQLLSPKLWRRKCCLPFVVMMLPAWHPVPEIPVRQYLQHLRWTYRLGHFFGSLDDAVDLQKDIVSGHPNRWNGACCRSQTAVEIAKLGRNVLSAWDARVAQNRHNSVIRETFLTAISQWLKPAPNSAPINHL